ncbi:uncharacterized protein N7458_003393 [Penicillium daleae]|uniref:5'-3' DNA helicase ZGRF1-like N-terminal domain-containing protein n=1 Tax=Penicillium daleae TaxID=63821 RepID=A0AAD6G759_9EURO|nr:uncharacterized protein N7458_003393 [Penicillium daleae]KAJ5461841.1 hypothetical protein N7458_003393 [Penicillium daleae]
MTAPASSTPRGTAPTSSASVPASSSPLTASVIKFRCLYTHDLRRKSKRWQDGYLRYHAFNKRVMVYDETGNYIGDHHWRCNDEVQDGDEMELDKGALIQVGERMGTTQTDLSNLFEKRKSSQGSPQATDGASQTPRASAPVRSSGSSQPFRSLNELLGIKKTPIGHLVSPYEELHPPTPAAKIPESSERTPKRQKISSTVRSIEKAPVNERNTQSQVVDLTDQEDESSVIRAPNFDHGRKPPRESHRQPALPKNDLGLNSQPSSMIGSRNIQQPAISARSATQIFVKPVLPTSGLSKSHPSKSVPPVASKEVRNEQFEARRSANIAVKPTPRPSQREAPRKAPELTNPTRPDSPTFVKPALPSSLERRKSRSPRPPSAAPKDGQAGLSEARKPASGAVPHADRSTPDKVPKGPVNTLRMATEKPRRKLMYSALLPGDASQRSAPALSSSSGPSSRSQPIIKSAESQSVRTQKRLAISLLISSFRPDTAPLQEIESTNAEFMPSDSTQFILEEMITPILETGLAQKTTVPPSAHQNPLLSRNLPAKRALDAPLRKSLSDPTALTTVQTRPTLSRSALSAVPEQHEPVEEGPWTSEALDLFDFWPPGRPKPCSAE